MACLRVSVSVCTGVRASTRVFVRIRASAVVRRLGARRPPAPFPRQPLPGSEFPPN